MQEKLEEKIVVIPGSSLGIAKAVAVEGIRNSRHLAEYLAGFNQHVY